TKKLEEAHPPEATRLADAEQDQVIPQSLLPEQSFCSLAVSSEAFDCVLGIGVVPRDTVVIEEREQLLPALLKALPERLGRLRPKHLPHHPVEEGSCGVAVLLQVSLLQAVLVHRLHDVPQEPAEVARDRLKFPVEGVVEQRLVHVTHQMNE